MYIHTLFNPEYDFTLWLDNAFCDNTKTLSHENNSVSFDGLVNTYDILFALGPNCIPGKTPRYKPMGIISRIDRYLKSEPYVFDSKLSGICIWYNELPNILRFEFIVDVPIDGIGSVGMLGGIDWGIDDWAVWFVWFDWFWLDWFVWLDWFWLDWFVWLDWFDWVVWVVWVKFDKNEDFIGEFVFLFFFLLLLLFAIGLIAFAWLLWLFLFTLWLLLSDDSYSTPRHEINWSNNLNKRGL